MKLEHSIKVIYLQHPHQNNVASKQVWQTVTKNCNLDDQCASRDVHGTNVGSFQMRGVCGRLDLMLLGCDESE